MLNLSLLPEQQDMLSRLAIFEGGASENALLDITELPEHEWLQLRQTLEQASLITKEQIHPVFPRPYIRFHRIFSLDLRTHIINLNLARSLRNRFVWKYYDLADTLRNQVSQIPQIALAMAKYEMPNMRFALDFLVQRHEVDAVASMGNSIAWFLSKLGLSDEYQQVSQQIDIAIDVLYSSSRGDLTYVEYMRESSLAKDERHNGKLQAAEKRLMDLLERMRTQMNMASLRGPDSYSYAYVLMELAVDQKINGDFKKAQENLDGALQITEVLLQQTPENRLTKGLYAHILVEQGILNVGSGNVTQAQQLYEKALREQQEAQNQLDQIQTLTELGNLFALRNDYAHAHDYYQRVLSGAQSIGSPDSEAMAWYNLGMLALKQRHWDEAEECFQKSQRLSEILQNTERSVKIYLQRGTIAIMTDRLEDARKLLTAGLDLAKPDSAERAYCLANLVQVLLKQYRKQPLALPSLEGLLAQPRKQPLAPSLLEEARSYAEQSLRIKEKIKEPTEIWNTFRTLAEIATLEGNQEQEAYYQKQERDSYVSDARNQYLRIGRHWEYVSLITNITAAAQGIPKAYYLVEASLSNLEASGWSADVSDAIRRIISGERNWDSLTNALDRDGALLIRCTLDALTRLENAKGQA